MTATMPDLKTMPKRKQRMRPLPPDVNSRNLAIEKRRRQDMNRTFLEIARCLPKLASSKRLTKNLIVGESLQQLRRQREVCIATGRELQELLSAHNNLIAEVNTLRSQLGVPVFTAPRTPSTAFLAIMEVERQPCGQFPDGFGSPSAAEEQDSQARKPAGEEEPLLAVSPADAPTPLTESSVLGPSLGLQQNGNVGLSEDWQMYSRTAADCFSLSTLNPSDMNWWALSELNCDMLWDGSSTRVSSLDQTYNHVLQENLQNGFEAFSYPYP